MQSPIFQISTMLNNSNRSRKRIIDCGLAIINMSVVDEDSTHFDRTWKSHFGVSVEVASKVWDLMIGEELVPKSATVRNLLWALHWLKCYPTESVGASKVGVCDRKWRDVTTDFLLHMSYLEERIVSVRTCLC